MRGPLSGMSGKISGGGLEERAAFLDPMDSDVAFGAEPANIERPGVILVMGVEIPRQHTLVATGTAVRLHELSGRDGARDGTVRGITVFARRHRIADGREEASDASPPRPPLRGSRTHVADLCPRLLLLRRRTD